MSVRSKAASNQGKKINKSYNEENPVCTLGDYNRIIGNI